jgi:anti-sigma regulatory factor (Ser/Thr protein kinase)
MPGNELKLELTSKLDMLAMVRGRIRKFAQSFRLSTEVIDNLELAVDEAVANAIEHAYPNREDGVIHVRAWKADDKLHVAIRDWGKGYKPKPVSSTTVQHVMKKHARRGLGRYLMATCMDKVNYISLPKQYNETQMIKRIGQR